MNVFTLSDRRTCNRALTIGGGTGGRTVCGQPAIMAGSMNHGDAPVMFRCLTHIDDFAPATVVGVYPADEAPMTQPAIMFRDLEAELDLLEERVQTIRDRGTVFDSVVADLRAINSQLSQVLQALR